MNVVFVLLALAWQGGDAALAAPVVLAQVEAEHGHGAAASEESDSTIAAEDEVWDELPPMKRESYLVWTYKALGIRYSLLFFLTGPLVFFGALLVVALCKRPGPIAAFFPLMALPVWIGIIGFFDGMIISMSVMSYSGGAPNASDIAAGIGMALVTPFVGLALTAPSYLILSIGLFVRTLLQRGPAKEL